MSHLSRPAALCPSVQDALQVLACGSHTCLHLSSLPRLEAPEATDSPTLGGISPSILHFAGPPEYLGE